MWDWCVCSSFLLLHVLLIVWFPSVLCSSPSSSPNVSFLIAVTLLFVICVFPVLVIVCFVFLFRPLFVHPFTRITISCLLDLRSSLSVLLSVPRILIISVLFFVGSFSILLLSSSYSSSVILFLSCSPPCSPSSCHSSSSVPFSFSCPTVLFIFLLVPSACASSSTCCLFELLAHSPLLYYCSWVISSPLLFSPPLSSPLLSPLPSLLISSALLCSPLLSSPLLSYPLLSYGIHIRFTHNVVRTCVRNMQKSIENQSKIRRQYINIHICI